MLSSDGDALAESLGGRIEDFERRNAGCIALPDDNMSMFTKVLTLTLQAKVLGEKVQELANSVRHRLVPASGHLLVLAEDTEFTLLLLSPSCWQFFVELQSLLGIRDVVIGVCLWINVEGLS